MSESHSLRGVQDLAKEREMESNKNNKGKKIFSSRKKEKQHLKLQKLKLKHKLIKQKKRKETCIKKIKEIGGFTQFFIEMAVMQDLEEPLKFLKHNYTMKMQEFNEELQNLKTTN